MRLRPRTAGRLAPVEAALARLAAGLGATLLFIAAIAAGSALGYAAPGLAQPVAKYIDPTVLLLVALLVFEVRLGDVARNSPNVRFLTIAWLTNFVLVPTVGFVIATLFLKGEPLFFTGLVIYFIAPCTDWFLGFTRLAGGNTALGAVLLPINMVTQLLLYPVYLSLFATGVAPLGALTIAGNLLDWFLAPFVVALTGHRLLKLLLPAGSFARLLAWTGYAIPFVVALLIFEIFVSNIAVIIDHASTFGLLLIAIFLFFVATFLLSEAISRLAGFAYPERALLTMTTAARNAPMMLGVTAVAMPGQPLVYAAIVIGMLVEFPHLTALRHILVRGSGPNASGRPCRQDSLAKGSGATPSTASPAMDDPA